ncbi:MAG TPA: tRNA 4-thiouridine(8) synthase ThiI, partial [Nanoarchaeota archaeon]|nr:tRNA 4-thiouridine(8) synthase ThiI [Nanoarchaeota archaeon]
MGKKALLLLSGGIDSPVSGYLMQKLGLEIIALHFSNEPFTDNGPEIKSKKLFEHLHFKKFIVMNISDILGNVAKKCKREYYFIIM